MNKKYIKLDKLNWPQAEYKIEIDVNNWNDLIYATTTDKCLTNEEWLINEFKRYVENACNGDKQRNVELIMSDYHKRLTLWERIKLLFI